MADLHAGPARRVVIVGGGTAGWMTAALFSQLLKGDFSLTLVESEQIGTIGVGEATIPPIRTFMRLAGIDDLEMIRETRATFKLGIEFVDWRDLDTTYMHGFGKIGQDFYWMRMHHVWLQLAGRPEVKSLDYYALNCLAARRNKFCFPNPKAYGSPLADLDYAFHLDASLLAAFLRRVCEGRGVKRVEGKIVKAHQRDGDGFVESVQLEDGRRIEGDFFIDCSGMRGLLISETLGVGFEDWSQWLLCDRALAAPSGNTAPLTPYTRSTAREAGWQWRIPLQHRTGNGLVYSSSLMSDDAAAATLHANLDAPALAEPRPVRFKPGKRHKSWEKNVVAIGLSSGFLEPLESTSIHLIQTACLRLLSLFPRTGYSPSDVEEFNAQADFEFRDVRDFIIAHYKVTNREDTPFWAYVKNMSVPDSLAERLELFRSSGRFFIHGSAELFRVESWAQVLIGQGLQMRPDPLVEMVPDEELLQLLRDVEETIADVADAMPLHSDFIIKNCAAPDLKLAENASAHM